MINLSPYRIVGRFEMDDTGNVYLKSNRSSDGAFVGSLEFDPISYATFLNGGTGSYLSINGFDNVTLSSPMYAASPTLTGTVTLPSWFMLGTDNVSMNQNLRTTDNVTFNTVTATNGFISTPSASVAGYFDLTELTGNGADKIRIQAPDSITTSYTIKLPAAACASGSFLVSGGDNTYSCAANIAGTAGNVSGTPALPNGTTATTQSANDNSTKLATTAYVDQRYEYIRASVPEPTTADNVLISGPSFRSWAIDNVVAVVMDNTGKLSGSAADNVTFNIQYSSDSAFSSPTNVYTSNVTATGAANYSGALNNTTPPAGSYIRFVFASSNMSYKRLFIQIRYREL